MEVQSNGSVKPPVKDGIVEGVKFSGWLTRYVPGGWFRKHWIKKWGVLIDDRVYLYDSQSINNNDTKSSHVINLLQCNKCGEPEAKELKKHPNSFQLEMRNSYVPFPKRKPKKSSHSTPRELFDVENETEKTRWLEKITEAIAAAKQAEKTNLDHVTKSRPKPRAVKRRPPSRHHIRQIASQSQLLPGDVGFENSPEPTEEPSVRKGSVPAVALKPPITVTSDHAKDENEKSSDSKHESTPSSGKPTPVPRRKSTLTPTPNEETDGSKLSSRSNSPIPPPTPSKSLKPKLVRSNYDNQSDDVTASIGNSDAEDQVTSPSIPHVLPLKFPGLKPTASPRSTRSLDRRDLFEQARARSAHNPISAKPRGEVDTRSMLLKSHALKLPAFPGTDSLLTSNQGKSRSMTLLDRLEDLPPPPVPPPAESVSDIEISSENIRPRKKKHVKKRRDRSSSNPHTTDDEKE